MYNFAIKYFGLPPNHIPVIEDAITFVETARQLGRQREHYDYIIHDVFTGGAEPAALFTTDFLTGLSHLLKADGVIAIVRPPSDEAFLFDGTEPRPELRRRSVTPLRQTCDPHHQIYFPQLPHFP